MRYFSLLWLILLSLISYSSFSFAAETDTDKLMDLLVTKGVITGEEAAALQADLAIKKQEEKELQKEFIVTAGRLIKISGYTQNRYRQDKSINNTFDIRRARIDIKGEITGKFDYRLQADFAGASTKLIDATIAYKLHPHVKLTFGQFKIPFSQENLQSNPKLETVNRSQVVEGLVARGKDIIGNHNGRDVGFQAGESFGQYKDFYLFDYAFGILNGAGINVLDTNDGKDFVGRLVFHPLKEWSIGGALYSGKYTLSSAPTKKSDRERIGGEFAYNRDPISLKGEYISGKDGIFERDGWYVLGTYFFIPKILQGVIKFDTYDPNRKLSRNETNVCTIGGNWYFNKWAYVQINYELKDELGKELNNNSLLGQLTLQF